MSNIKTIGWVLFGTGIAMLAGFSFITSIPGWAMAIVWIVAGLVMVKVS